MPNRTQIVCLHEGARGSIDPIFINRLLKDIAPAWIRPWPRSNVIRTVGCSGRAQLIARMPTELKACLEMGSDTTLMVWADIDDDLTDVEALKKIFWQTAQKAGISREDFDKVVFVFAKDRLENWIEFLIIGVTDENREGPRVEFKQAVAAARKLAKMCNLQTALSLPPSLDWSCKNWRELVARMKP